MQTTPRVRRPSTGTLFSGAKDLDEIPVGSPNGNMTPNTRGVEKIGIFDNLAHWSTQSGAMCSRA